MSAITGYDPGPVHRYDPPGAVASKRGSPSSSAERAPSDAPPSTPRPDAATGTASPAAWRCRAGRSPSAGRGCAAWRSAFAGKILPLFRRRTKELGLLLPELYLHGLSLGDFELALRGLHGEGAPLSPLSIARLKASWQLQYDVWKTRALSDRELVYVWADGMYVKAGTGDRRDPIACARSVDSRCWPA